MTIVIFERFKITIYNLKGTNSYSDSFYTLFVGYYLHNKQRDREIFPINIQIDWSKFPIAKFDKYKPLQDIDVLFFYLKVQSFKNG